ncbi:MAG: FGGY-family carbohydrate kinase [Planctomycetes bacterium]|nr:FGGY-family carbohydrate kinase [Planctomycetota bacterium]
MEQTPYILAISSDFTRLEVGLVDTAGRVAAIQSAPVRLVSKATGQVYIDPLGLVRTAGSAVKALLELKPREARRIVGVGLIGRSPAVCLADTSGPKMPFILPNSADGRQDAASPDVSWDEVYEKTGLTLQHSPIPHVLRNAVAKIPGKMLTPKDFLKWALTGEFTTDPLDAQRTLLWNLAQREWSADLCGIFGVDADNLPDVVAATSHAGNITSQASRATGLKEGLPVACGMGDWGEYLGAGAFEASDAFEHIGTTGAFYGVTDVRPLPETRLDVRPHVNEGLYLAGREGLPGGTCLEWLLKKSHLARSGEIDWPQAEEELEAAAAMGRPENVLFFPSLSGQAGQVSQAAFLNLHIEDSLTSLIQGLMEGIFFNLKAVAEELRAVPWTFGAVYTTGQIGFKHAPRRMRAHIYGRRVHAGRTPGANTICAALVGAVACGAYATLEEARSGMLNIDGGTSPDEYTKDLYEAHYASWVGTRDFLATQTRS